MHLQIVSRVIFQLAEVGFLSNNAKLTWHNFSLMCYSVSTYYLESSTILYHTRVPKGYMFCPRPYWTVYDSQKNSPINSSRPSFFRRSFMMLHQTEKIRQSSAASTIGIYTTPVTVSANYPRGQNILLSKVTRQTSPHSSNMQSAHAFLGDMPAYHH